MTGSFEMDSRPSDAIAIALRFDAPIYLDDKVIEKSKGSGTETGGCGYERGR